MPAITNALYRDLILSSQTALCVTDTNRRIQLVNPAFTRLYGYEEDEILGESPSILEADRSIYFENGVYQGEYERLVRSMQKFFSSPEEAQWEGKVLHRCKGDTLTWVKQRLSAVRDDAGNISGYLWATEDIAEDLEEDLKIRMEIYRAITGLAETRDNETGNHLKRIAAYSRLLAEELGMPKAFADQIELFSPLHDIGKVGIPDQILLAPRKLTDEEFSIMRTHTTLGYQILAGRSTLEMAAEIARFHHERYDGKGYPEGVGGGAIPISARITALADVYDALTSERPYKRAWPHEEAQALIESEAGSHFDPLVVQAFQNRLSGFDEVRRRDRELAAAAESGAGETEEV